MLRHCKYMLMKWVAFFFRVILSIRYKVDVKSDVDLTKAGPVLFLSNHQSLTDPQILLSWLYPYKAVAPLITERYVTIPLLSILLKKLHAVPVPDLELRRGVSGVMEQINKEVINRFDQHISILLYPSGQLTIDGSERIGNKRSAYELVKILPPAVPVYAITIEGLWGSMWSRYRTGKTPGLAGCIFKSILITIVNLVFFVPKRRVKIYIRDISHEAKKNANESKSSFNQWLEPILQPANDKPYKPSYYFFT